MVLTDQLKAIERTIDSLRPDDAELLASMLSPSPAVQHISNIKSSLDEARHYRERMDEHCYHGDVHSFNSAVRSYLGCCGRVFAATAKKEYEAKYMHDVEAAPYKVFRWLTPDVGHFPMTILDKPVVVVSYYSAKLMEPIKEDGTEIFYSMDELNAMKDAGFNQDARALALINKVKQVFPGSVVKSVFDEYFEPQVPIVVKQETKNNGNQEEQVGVNLSNGDKRFAGSLLPRTEYLPLEERQRYIPRSA